jgi:hypothetical protein
MKATWKGGLVGALFGCVLLVFGGHFKGNLGEPEFIAEYIGFLIPSTVVGAIGAFLISRRQKRASEVSVQELPRSRLFISALVILPFIVIAKVAADFPHGEGLFHPSHDALAADINKTCLEKQAGNMGGSRPFVAAFCSCFADKVADAALSDRQEAPELAAQRATRTCLGQ